MYNCKIKYTDLLHLIENTFERKRNYANLSSNPNPKARSILDVYSPA